MIPKITRGDRVAGLIRYLYGPGRFNEHTNPHIVAGFRHPAALEPRLLPSGRRDFRDLVEVLNMPLTTQRRRGPRLPVWQCSVRAAPSDRALSDDEWALVAGEVVHQVRIALRGDDSACRWVAVRHAEDHIHIVAVLAREDGRRVSVHNDYYRAMDACHLVEHRFGLRSTAPADKTVPPAPTRAETEQAKRVGWTQPPRVTLRRTVQEAASSAGTVEEFLTLLHDDPQVRLRVRHSYRNLGQVTGYAVALEGHLDRTGEPVWFSGGKLAPDLTIPQLRRRYAPSADLLADRRPLASSGADTMILTGPYPAAAGHADTRYRMLSEAVAEATRVLASTTDPRVRGDLARAAGDTLHLAAQALDLRGLTDAARTFGRAAREPYRRAPFATQHGHALRRAARILAIDASARGKPEPAVAALHLLAGLIDLVAAVQEQRQLRRQTAQAAAARDTIDHLKAVHTAFGPPIPDPVFLPPPPAETSSVPGRARPKTAAGIAASDFPTGSAVTRRPVRRGGQPVAQPIKPARPRVPGAERGPRL